MSKPEQKRWQRTSPLAALFYLGRILQAIAKNAVQSLAPIAAYLFATEGPLVSRIAWAVAAAIVFVLVASVLRYWFFRYRITSDSILIREGVFKKTQLDIKFDRVQAINTEQNFVYRFFGVVTASFDTAGSAGQEGSLPAIKEALAESLKARIRHARPAAAMPAGGTETTDSTRRLLTLGNADMVRIGLSSNRALVFLVLLGPVLERLEQGAGRTIEASDLSTAIDNTSISLLNGAGLAAIIAAAVVVLLMLASVAGAFLRYHRFTLVADDDVWRSTGGLVTRHEHAVNLAKVQTLEAVQNAMLRLFGRFRLVAKQASSGGTARDKHFIVPLCTVADLPRLDREVFGEEFGEVEMQPQSARFQPIAARYLSSRILLTGVFPAVLLALIMLPAFAAAAYLPLLWIPIDALGIWTKYRKYGFFAHADGMVLRRGFIGYRMTAFLHRKVQRVSITQTPSQRRKGLATMRFFLASGMLKLPYVDHEKAMQLRDFILYRVESSSLAWH